MTNMKRQPILAFLFLAASINAYCQKETTNTLTTEHKQVRGTKVYIIPPDGFINATNFLGFQQSQSSSSIMVTEIPGPFSVTIKGLDESGLKTQGMILKDKKAVKVNGYDGLFLKTEQFAYENYFTKYVLAFGNNDFTVMIVGLFPKKLKAIEKDIIKSLYSAFYDLNLQIDIAGSVDFGIDIENTKLKMGKLIMGSLVYTVDGKVPTDSDDETFFQVGMSLSPIEVNDKKLYALNRVRKMPFDNLEIDENEINIVEIDGVTGYEIVAYGISQKSKDKELIYTTMLYTDNGYYLLNGTAKDDFENNTILFRNLTRTFKRK
jgi:hypothetical protein